MSAIASFFDDRKDFAPWKLMNEAEKSFGVSFWRFAEFRDLLDSFLLSKLNFRHNHWFDPVTPFFELNVDPRVMFGYDDPEKTLNISENNKAVYFQHILECIVKQYGLFYQYAFPGIVHIGSRAESTLADTLAPALQKFCSGTGDETSVALFAREPAWLMNARDLSEHSIYFILDDQ